MTLGSKKYTSVSNTGLVLSLATFCLTFLVTLVAVNSNLSFVQPSKLIWSKFKRKKNVESCNLIELCSVQSDSFIMNIQISAFSVSLLLKSFFCIRYCQKTKNSYSNCMSKNIIFVLKIVKYFFQL